MSEAPATVLPDLAARINKLHSEIGAALRLSLQHAIEIGGILADAKLQIGHGEFGRWLADNVEFSDRTARRYMLLFEKRDRLKSDTVSDLKTAYGLLEAHSEPDLEARETVSDTELEDPSMTLELLKTMERYEHFGKPNFPLFYRMHTPKPGQGYMTVNTLGFKEQELGQDIVIVKPAIPQGYFWITIFSFQHKFEQFEIDYSAKQAVRGDGVALVIANELAPQFPYSGGEMYGPAEMKPSSVNPFEVGVA